MRHSFAIPQGTYCAKLYKPIIEAIPKRKIIGFIKRQVCFLACRYQFCLEDDSERKRSIKTVLPNMAFLECLVREPISTTTVSSACLDVYDSFQT